MLKAQVVILFAGFEIKCWSRTTCFLHIYRAFRDVSLFSEQLSVKIC